MTLRVSAAATRWPLLLSLLCLLAMLAPMARAALSVEDLLPVDEAYRL